MNNDLEVAHPRSGSSSTWFLVELEFGFWWEGKTGVPGEKPLAARERTNNKLNPCASTRIWTRAALVGGKCSHHCATPCCQFHLWDSKIWEGKSNLTLPSHSEFVQVFDAIHLVFICDHSSGTVAKAIKWLKKQQVIIHDVGCVCRNLEPNLIIWLPEVTYCHSDNKYSTALSWFLLATWGPNN